MSEQRPVWLQDRVNVHEIIDREAPDFDQTQDKALVAAADIVLALAAWYEEPTTPTVGAFDLDEIVEHACQWVADNGGESK